MSATDEIFHPTLYFYIGKIAQDSKFSTGFDSIPEGYRILKVHRWIFAGKIKSKEGRESKAFLLSHFHSLNVFD